MSTIAPSVRWHGLSSFTPSHVARAVVFPNTTARHRGGLFGGRRHGCGISNIMGVSAGRISQIRGDLKKSWVGSAVRGREQRVRSSRKDQEWVRPNLVASASVPVRSMPSSVARSAGAFFFSGGVSTHVPHRDREMPSSRSDRDQCRVPTTRPGSPVEGIRAFGQKMVASNASLGRLDYTIECCSRPVSSMRSWRDPTRAEVSTELTTPGLFSQTLWIRN